MQTRIELSPESRVLVLTGAGVSAESGVPTFRGLDGLWEGHPIEQVASPEGFETDPALVWRFYSLRREGALKVEPNPGHHALVELEQRLGDRFLLATQNVDGLHRRAGSRRVLAMHGELFESRCEKCNDPFEDESSWYAPHLPRCERCGGRVRPNIVWFGEALDGGILDTITRFIREAGHSLLFLAVGTSGIVYPAAGLVELARRVGGRTLLVDPAPTGDHARRFHRILRGKSGEVLPKLFRE